MSLTETDLALGLQRSASRPTRTKPKMLLIVNPKATTVSARLKSLVIYALRGGYEVEAIETEAQNHAIDITREVINARGEDSFDLVVAFGGDGTVNEAANGLAGTGVPLSILPGGLTNVACRMLGIPNDVVKATEHLLRLGDRLSPRRVDLGKANDRHFFFSSGVGLDADVTKWVDSRPRAKSKGGVLTFTYAAINTYLRDYRGGPAQVAVEIDGRSYEGLSAIVQNSDPYTYFGSTPLRVCEDIAIDNGALSMMVMQRSKVRDAPGVVSRLFSTSGCLADHPQAASLTGVKTARMVPAGSDPDIPVEVDGEYVGNHSEVIYRACPGALLVVS